MLYSLDLFSGIGGITHALRDLGIAPAMYVEIHKAAQDVLKARMASGDLPVAPIHNDIRTLKTSQIPKKIDIILAGSPCIGFSSAGLRQGLEHEQSGLFRQIIRLAKDLKPKFMFFENVAAIRTTGLKDVTGIIQKLGYHCWWVILPAFAVGSPQFRRRWYCLCVRRSALNSKLTLHLQKAWKPYNWTREPVPRMVTKPEQFPDSHRRSFLLGNSVVPDAVRCAFLLLWTGLSDSLQGILARKSWTLQPPAKRAPHTATDPSVAGAFMLGDTATHRVPHPKDIPPNPKESTSITLVPSSYKPPPTQKKNPFQTAKVITKPVVLRGWASPRAGMTHACYVLTERSQRDIQTQLRYEKSTPQADRGGIPNPDWLDWLMGFPVGWTSPTVVRRKRLKKA